MSDLKKRINNASDKIAGETKAAAGRLTGDKKLEVKGNLQSITADIRTNAMDVKKDIKKSIHRKDIL